MCHAVSNDVTLRLVLADNETATSIFMILESRITKSSDIQTSNNVILSTAQK